MKSLYQPLYKLFQKWPFISRVVLTLMLVGVAFILGGLIERTFPIKKYFPFTGLILLILVTWLMYRLDGKSLEDLGLNFKPRNLSLLFLGLILGSVAFVLAKGLRMLYTGEGFEFNGAVDWQSVTLGLYYILPMVAVEELLFRGYLFKKTIEKSSVLWANVIFATIFMLVHVIDNNILSSPGMILFYVITIPIGHLLFATALLKSKTLMFPMGLHLGNNWASFHIITDAQKEGGLSFVTNPASFETWDSFLGFILIWNGLFLLLTWLIWKWPVGKIVVK